MGRRFRWPWRRRVAVFAGALIVVPILTSFPTYRPAPAWSIRGGAGLVAMAGRTAAVPAETDRNANYVPGTSIVRTADGDYLAPGEGGIPVHVPPGPIVDSAVEESRAWLAKGMMPGAGTSWSDMGVRALLDLRALTTPEGGVVAAWHGSWSYVWPRDASFAAAAYCLTGHAAEGVRVLDFFARVQADAGTWAARYHPDGRPVDDGRRPQLDANGWVVWAAWLCASATDDSARHWPMVRAAANAAVRSLSSDGLPRPTPDYWETSSDVTLGTAAPLLAGLRAAADLGWALGHPDEAMRYEGAAGTLATAIESRFRSTGYRRQPDAGSGHDAAVTFLAPPFAAADADVTMATAESVDVLTVPNGGVKPGENWRGHPGEAWTPETAFFALAAAASGDTDGATRWLDWLDAHRTPLGALPERVSAAGDPVSVAPLSWTCALVILTLSVLNESLPTPPE